ncbi:TonB-dependent receptor [Gayadomonas joobiniege]|uniref:TonB-dependent receptor n=1 Tax=Gayadomonas joobiniege TaxID=1234606 RepID=UPI00036572A0|nr:TonB-dependent receptor [Gayadomonas joobiniege]
MQNIFRLSAVTLAVAGTFASFSSVAAESAQNEDLNADENIETIEITGFRGSLQKAVNAKRFSQSVSDSIHAEDVGKSTDQNIADALSRVTGVTVQDEGGEGTRISVRGAGPSLNQISINGVALTGGFNGGTGNPSADQSVDLSAFSSNILSSIDVIKTSAADHNEGSLGANVVLRTVKPLGLNKPRRNLQAEVRYNDFSDEHDYLLSGSFSEKLLDDSLGFIITVTKEQIKSRQDRINTSWIDGAIQIEDLESSTGLKAHDTATGKYIRILQEGQTTDDLTNWDPDTQVAHQGDLFVLARNTTNMMLNTNVNDRLTLNTGLQWKPSDSTDIQLDITHTQRTTDVENHTMRLNHAPAAGFSSADPIADFNRVNIATQTLEKSLGRTQSGMFNISTGETEIETNVVSLKAEHWLTENLKAELTGGYSKTTDKTDNFIGLTSATWGTTTGGIIENMPSEILEPIGYDCDGSECSYFSGTQQSVIDPLDGSISYATSRFNPFDLQANHLGALNFRNNTQTDTNKTLFLDFDWLLNFDHFTKAEFGVKYSSREKDVFTQNETINNGQTVVDENDANLSYSTEGMQSVTAADMLSGNAFPYADFAEGLIADRSNDWFKGWPMLDPAKAIAEITQADAGSIGVTPNRAGTRNIQTETLAAYGKINFEFIDGRLTGNLGIRYVEDKNEASGVGSVDFYKNPHVMDPHDLLIVRRLADIEGSEPCPEPGVPLPGPDGNPDTRFGLAADEQPSGCWDWAITHGYDFRNQNTTPWTANEGWRLQDANGNTGPDVNRLVWVDYSGATPVVVTNNPLPNQIYDINGELVDTVRNNHRHFSQAGQVWQYLDLTTSVTGPNGNQANSYLRESSNSGSASNSLWLPSLNLNYAINAEMIGRFAVSKTMARPRFDSLNPRLAINENIWQPAATGQVGNIALQPLESKNLDISWEWYFNDTGLLSAAFFYKDMTNFEETVNTPFHYRDIRTDYNPENLNILLPINESRLPGDEDNCMPHRYAASQNNAWAVECHQANLDVITNGEGATIGGIELSYTQNYDFLPGLLSGLGLSVNYTYQESESDAEQVGNSGRTLKPLPQPFTPEHSSNTALFWEKDGLELRLAHRYNSLQLVDRGLIGGASWMEPTNRLDFSSTYKLNKTLTLTFHATNLTDDKRRVFYTSSETANIDDLSQIVMDEGNVMENSGITQERTLSVFRNGRQFRLGLRASF